MNSHEGWAELLLKTRHEDDSYVECLYAWADWAEENGLEHAYGLRWLGKHHRDPRGNTFEEVVWWSDREWFAGRKDFRDEDVWYWYLPLDVFKRLPRNENWEVRTVTKQNMSEIILAAAEAVCAARTDDPQLSMPYLLDGGPVTPSSSIYRTVGSRKKRSVAGTPLALHQRAEG
jgi:hypothetical protein